MMTLVRSSSFPQQEKSMRSCLVRLKDARSKHKVVFDENLKPICEVQPFTIRLLEYIFAIFGIYPNPEYKKYGSWYCFFFYFFIFPSSVLSELSALSAVNTYTENIDIALFLISTCSIANCLHLVHSRAELLGNIYRALTVNDFIDQIFFAKCDEILKSMMLRLGIFVSMCVAMLTVYPFIIGVATETEWGSLSTLIFPARYPWSMNTFRRYLLTIFLQICLSLHAFFIINGIILFAVVMRMILHVFFVVMQDKIEHIVGNGHTVAESDWNAREKLHDVIRFHQFFNKFVCNVVDLIKPCVVVATIQFMAANICAISLIIVVTESHLYKLKVINMMIISDLFFFLCCYMGEWLSNLNYRTLNDLYKIQWYQQAIPFREDLIIFMLILQKPFKLQMYSMVTINLALFSRAFRNTYSVVQIVLKSLI